MAKELETKNKTIWSSMWAIMIVSMTALIAGIFIAAFLIPEGIWQLVTIIGICIVFLIPCFYALKLEVSVGAYKCKNCGHEIVPTYKEVLMAKIDELVKELYSMVGEYILGEDMENLAEVLAYKMKTEGKTLAVAESCSGGAIASSITQKAGASKYFKGGVVAYSNAVKENVLGVKSSTLAEHGAVSEETATEMVRGVLKLMDADYAIATTGIAGPGGGTPEKPVGTVWIAVASKDEVFAQKMTFGDDRLRVIERTANQAFANMLKLITKKLC
jgi:PncC family amidohydrolase